MMRPPEPSTAEAVFVPDPLPRRSHLALWHPGGVPVAPGDCPSRVDEVELVVPTARSVRRRGVHARLLRIGDVLGWLTGLGPGDEPTVSLAAWVVATRLGVELVARGRLLPAVTDDGDDTWRVGPLDAADDAHLAELAQRFPPSAHALPVAGAGPARIADPATLVRACWDAIADAFVRTAAASTTVTSRAWAAREPAQVGELAVWLEQCTASEGDGARPGLRLELGDGVTGARVVLQLRSRADPSLVIDAAELWDAPAVVLRRLGEEAEADLLLALRRGARVWPPAGRLLDDARPSVLDLDEDDTAEFLGLAADALAAAGFEVLWPAELTRPTLELRAVVRSPAPAAVSSAGLSLDALCECSWEASLDGQALTAAELDVLAEAKRSLVRLRGRWVLADPALLERLRHGAGSVRAGRHGAIRLTPAGCPCGLSGDNDIVITCGEGLVVGRLPPRLRGLG
jgi:hypothetical protein